MRLAASYQHGPEALGDGGGGGGHVGDANRPSRTQNSLQSTQVSFQSTWVCRIFAHVSL